MYPDEPVSHAIERMTPRDLSRLPVVERSNPRRLLGLIRRDDIGRAYNVGIMRRTERQHRVDQLRTGPVMDSEVMVFDIHQHSPAVGKMVHEIRLPEDCLLVAIRRGTQLIVPHGPTATRSRRPHHDIWDA
ncbi:MAG: CBS domain-containing protein [bacterium]|nr:CBS domain-containing protein [bacterium]